MSAEKINELVDLLGQKFKSNPWHGISAGDKAPEIVTSFIEIIPSDTVKYEIDKESGYMMVDRPQKFSNIVPALYGLIPQTYCDKEIANYCMEKTGRTGIVGDGDPLDIIVLTEREITHGDLLVDAVPIGGFRMIDGGEADDKIVAVLKGDSIYENFKDLSEIPSKVLDRLLHYFLTYKEQPGVEKAAEVEITHNYGKEEALEVIRRSQKDYADNYGNVNDKIKSVLGDLLA